MNVSATRSQGGVSAQSQPGHGAEPKGKHAMHSSWQEFPRKSPSLSGTVSTAKDGDGMKTELSSSSRFIFITTDFRTHSVLGNQINQPRNCYRLWLNLSSWSAVQIHQSLLDVGPGILVLWFWSGHRAVVHFINVCDNSDRLWNLRATCSVKSSGMKTSFWKRLKREATFIENLLCANSEHVLSHLIFITISRLKKKRGGKYFLRRRNQPSWK